MCIGEGLSRQLPMTHLILHAVIRKNRGEKILQYMQGTCIPAGSRPTVTTLRWLSDQGLREF